MRQPNRRRRPLRKEGEGGRDRWLITYADLITLLLIFFVVMYAMSQLDSDKYQLVTQSLQATFQSGDSILEIGSGITGKADTEKHKNPDAPQAEPEAPAEAMTERELAFRDQEKALSDFMAVIEQYVKEHQLEEDIFIADEPRGIAITLSDRFLFDTGHAELKPGAAPVLTKLASLFQGLDAAISIEGHTDNVPLSRWSSYKDNWELSGARAMSVLRFFIDESGLDPAGFQYAGYADTRPAADNATDDGRRKNRRVEITVLRQLQQ
ncbi:flagellar motor protein MotB [Paenibacillus sp. FSL M8-0334]|uniref:flagellar motor protein MotB n=1 Tax=Paenibacillus sp. FSL M8-0334 TaxID=2921623 RepID=UPI0030FC6BEF